MAIHLTSRDTSRVDVANRLFGEGGEGNGLLVIRPGRSSCKTWFTIPEGMYALVTKHGADMDYSDGEAVWPAGFHTGPPWVKVSHLVTKQSVVFDMPVKGCKTMDNVNVEIDLAVVFRIRGDSNLGEDSKLVRKFVHEVTPRGLEQQLRDALEEAGRALARSVAHTEVYGLRSIGDGASRNVEGLDLATTEGDTDGNDFPAEKMDDVEQQKTFIGSHDEVDSERGRKATKKGARVAAAMKRALNKQFHHQGVDISQVIIKNVTLPRDIEAQMSNKTMIISENAQQKMTQEFEMQQLNNNEEMETLKQKQSEDRQLENQDGDKLKNDLQLKLDNLRAEGTKQEQKLMQDSRTVIQSIQAQAELEVTRLNQEQSALLSESAATSEAKAAKLKAECDKYVETKIAEAELIVAQNRAKASEFLAEAEGQIAPMLRSLKDYQTTKLHNEVYSSLASNPDVVITGSQDDDINSMLVADAILSKPSTGPVNRSQILAELAMLQNGSKVYLRTDVGKSEGKNDI